MEKSKKTKTEIHTNQSTEDNSETSSPNEWSKKKNNIFIGIRSKFKNLSTVKLFYRITLALAVFSVIFIFLSLLLPQQKREFSGERILSFEKAISEFETRAGLEQFWFKEEFRLPDSVLYVNTNDSTLHFSSQTTDLIFRYKSDNSRKSIKYVLPEDSAKFDNFFNNQLNIQDVDSISKLAANINADGTYINVIKLRTGLKKRDILLSLIYATIAGNNEGHLAVSLKDKKLNRVKKLYCDRIDKPLFIEKMNEVNARDLLSTKSKFAISGLYTTNTELPSGHDSISDSVISVLNAFFYSDSVIVRGVNLDLNFIYYDFINEKLHIGNQTYSKNQISSPTLRNYVDQIKNTPNHIFYIDNDSNIISFTDNQTIKDDKFWWGTLDGDVIKSGEFEGNNIFNLYGLIRTWGGKIFPLYLALIFVFVFILFSAFNLAFKSNGLANSLLEIPNHENNTTEEEAEEEKKINEIIDTIQDEQQKKAISEYIKKLSDFRKSFSDINKISNSGYLVENILKCFDNNFNVSSETNFKELIENEKNAAVNAKLSEIFKSKKNGTNLESEIKKIIQFYDDLMNIRDENKLLDFLEKIHKENNVFPRIKSIKTEVKELRNNNDKNEIIKKILEIVDNYNKNNLSVFYSEIINQSIEYLNCKNLLSENINGYVSFNTYLNNKINEFNNKNNPTIIDYVDFALLFKIGKNDKDTIVKEYKETNELTTNLSNKLLSINLINNNPPGFWDRNKLCTLSIENVYKLMKIWGIESPLFDVWDATKQRIDRDFSQYFLLYTLYSEAINGKKDINQFKTAIETIIIENSIKQQLLEENFNNNLNVLFEKIRKYELSEVFVEKMWSTFVEDFRKNELDSDDKAWFYTHLYNITYHTVDYVDYFKNQKKLIYYPNLMLLQNNFAFDQIKFLDFQENHVDKSTKYTNCVYTWIKELNIEHLKVLIQKYKIKP